MKKTILYIISMVISCMACEPLEEQNSPGGAISPEELDICATAMIVDGVRSNKIIVENNSPLLSRWVCDSQRSNYAYDEFIVSQTGELTVMFIGRNADGSELIRQLTVTVEALLF